MGEGQEGKNCKKRLKELITNTKVFYGGRERCSFFEVGLENVMPLMPLIIRMVKHGNWLSRTVVAAP